MAAERIGYLPLAERIWPERDANRLIRFVALAVLGTVLLALSARIKVPFYPVPMTMQTCVVLLIGASYGARLGLATVLLYLAEGASGLPVFAEMPEAGFGLPARTGGYLIGFALAAFLAGRLANLGLLRSLPATFLGLLVADAVIFASGLVWLGNAIGWDKPVLSFGLYPFLLGDLLKVALASAALVAGQSILERKATGSGGPGD